MTGTVDDAVGSDLPDSATSLTSEEEELARSRPHRLSEIGLIAGLYAGSVGVAILLAALLVAVTGGSPDAVWTALLDGSIRQPGALGLTLSTAAPLLLVAVGAIVANKAGLVNIGQEGQVLVGAAAAAYAATRLGGAGPTALVVGLVAAVVGGALWAGLAAALRYGRGVPEVISTLLLVFVADQVVNFCLTKSWLLLDTGPNRTQRLNTGSLLPSDAQLPYFDFGDDRTHVGMLIAVGVAALAAFLLARSVWGFRLRMLGLNPTAARRAGVSAAVIGGGALLVSGGLAGFAGGVLLTAGPAYRMSSGFSQGVGWEGLLVALLARDRPGLAVPMAVVFAALRTGGGVLAATGVARNIVDVVQALLVLALLLPPVYLAIRDRRRVLAAARARI
ncbi:MAG: ABC transporter permease [Acidimicrobiales bacterium]